MFSQGLALTKCAVSSRMAAVRAGRRPRATSVMVSSFHSSPSTQQQQQQSNNDDKIEALFQKILWLDMFEVHILTELLNEKMGLADLNKLMASAPSSGTASTSSSDSKQEEEAVKEKTTFDLKLVGFDSKSKIKVIKEVRSIAELGLKEAKEMVEGAPKVIKKDLKKEQAEELQKKLEEVGATIEVV